MYKVDLLTGARDAGPHLTLLECYIEAARAMESMTDCQFFSRFGEASRVVGHLPGTADQAASRILDLHRRHGGEIGSVMTKAISQHAAAIFAGSLPTTCAITLSLPDSHKNRKTPSQLLTEYKVLKKIKSHELVADDLDLERSVYFDLKAGRRVGEETYVKAALRIGCSPDDLRP